MRREVESLLNHQQPTGNFIPTLVNDAADLLDHQEPSRGDDGSFIPGTILASRYRIIGLVGRGGMGEVYRADDLKLSQPIALKFLPDKLSANPDVLARFHQEVRIARQISHPNICRVFDIGEVHGRHFLSMEYIDGEDLASLLVRIGRLPENKAVEIASQLCAGLSAAHQEGVLHRDLKPANVMIDGRGRAKITDFGLAGLADTFEGHEVREGTPAYMAPEQLAGREVTTRSDLYSLGLVLYEIFTGKRAFEASTLEDLIRLQESTTPTSISSFVKEIDPLVERVILRCLERDPQERPQTVLQVAAALPGGDPLAAAIAAGETPSPEMVAAAPKEGALRPTTAIACLAGIIALLAFFVIYSDKAAVQNLVPFDKSPDVLAERASNILNRFGYSETPIDTAYGFGQDAEYFKYAKARDTEDELIKRLGDGQPALFYFWYRQSPRYLETISHENVSLTDPPMEVSNMASVRLDTLGRLLEFQAVPPQVDGESEPAQSPDWSALFSEAGLNIADFTVTQSLWVPPVGFDSRAAWTGIYPGLPRNPVRIEAAAYRGAPVYFQIVMPWSKPLRQEEVTSISGKRAAAIILTITFICGLIAALFLARYNLKLGRGDRRGAFRISLFVFSVTLAGSLILVDHVPTLSGELNILYQIIAWALALAGLQWLIYIALEPYARRKWPRLMISWNRLLAGEFRDPMVGRDILIGGLFGFGHTLSIYCSFVLPQLLGQPQKRTLGFAPLAGGVPTFFAALLSDILPRSFFIGLAYLFLILLFFVVLKKERLAAAVLWLVQFTIMVLAFLFTEPWYLWIFGAAIATCYVITAFRFGLLSLIALQFFFSLSYYPAMTTTLSSWYAGQTLMAVVVLLTIAVYSFYISLAGQPLFRTEILKE